MKFLQPLLFFRPSPLVLLDMAYIVVLLPLLLMLKVPMLIFVLMVFLLLFLNQKPARNRLLFIVFLLGMTALYISLYGAASFSGLSRLKIFLELLIYILLIVVSLQRLTRQINLYLLISPFLFLALSLFFYHGIIMLVYVIFEIFFLLWMILAHRMQGDMAESLRSSVLMFLYSLPWVVMLFVFFPRISFEYASYGFKGETSKRMGHDGLMYIDSSSLDIPSERIVMEVEFEQGVPHAKNLYFRGSTLYLDKGRYWAPLPQENNSTATLYQLPKTAKKINYKVTLYPTGKKWIYLLDMPMKTVEDSHLDSDLVSRYKDNIQEPLHYEGVSALASMVIQKPERTIKMASLLYKKNTNPLALQKAKEIQKKYSSDKERIDALLDFFAAQQLVYSLQPKRIDVVHSIDSFLFYRRTGYCVHFASSFVIMARMLGIPARVVTGYKADKTNSLGRYLVVKEKHAHAWSELYIDGAWHRYEPTSAAAYIDVQSQDFLNNTQEYKKRQTLLQKLDLYLMYIKYQIETWILYYSHIRQLQMFEYAKKNPSFVFGFAASIIVLVLMSIVFASYLKRPRHKIEALHILQPLLDRLCKEGYEKKDSESIHRFMIRVAESEPKYHYLNDIDKLYEEITYGMKNDKTKILKFKKMIKLSLKMR